MVVGLIGCGRMGMCILAKLVENQYQVAVYDKFEEPCKRAREKGAALMKTPAEVGRKAEIIIMSLPGSGQIEEVLFGEGGLYEAEGQAHIIVDTSTVEPETTRNNALRMAKKGWSYLDCPVLGRPSAAGRWTLPAGGNREALAAVKPVLSSFAGEVVYVGESGAGNALKLLNQMMFTAINGITSEVMAIAEHVGIKPEVFYNTVASSTAATVSGLFIETGKSILEENFLNPAFTVDLLIKDTELAVGMARKAGAPSVLAQTVQIYNQIAHAKGLGNQDTSAVYKVFNDHYKKEAIDEA